jgi:hypothetical protein
MSPLRGKDVKWWVGMDMDRQKYHRRQYLTGFSVKRSDDDSIGWFAHHQVLGSGARFEGSTVESSWSAGDGNLE